MKGLRHISIHTKYMSEETKKRLNDYNESQLAAYEAQLPALPTEQEKKNMKEHEPKKIQAFTLIQGGKKE